MKTYILFGNDRYYPALPSGAEIGRYATIEEVRRKMSETDWEFYDVLDLSTGEWLTVDEDDV